MDENSENDDFSKEIIKINDNSNQGMQILLNLINNNGFEKILNCLCKDNLDVENEIESKLNSLKNTYGDLKLIFMLLLFVYYLLTEGIFAFFVLVFLYFNYIFITF